MGDNYLGSTYSDNEGRICAANTRAAIQRPRIVWHYRSGYKTTARHEGSIAAYR
jgi:hypothetical protein